MSAGAQDQRKIQQPPGNAPKETGGVAEAEEAPFDAWRSQQHTSYSTSMSGMAQADPYMSSYYGGAAGYPPYQAFGVGDGAWSNGGDHLAFMGGYSQPPVQADSYGMDGMFGGQGFGGFGQPGFGGYGPFHGNGDYSAGWGGGVGRKYDDYYRGDPAAYGAEERGVKQVEQGMQRLSVDPKQSPHDPRLYGDLASAAGAGPQKKSWASIASQPARPAPLAGKMVMPLAGVAPHDAIGMWDGKNGAPKPVGPPAVGARSGWLAPRGRGQPPLGYPPAPPAAQQAPPPPPPTHPVLDELRDRNEYNPKEFDLTAKGARFFVIKSYSEDDIHRSIKYEIWCSTEHGNKRLDAAFRERESKGPIYLLYSVNGSGHFCGMAQMLSSLDFSSSSSVWAQDKWKGQFKVKWIYVKDVPNSQLRHIRLENNENKPVTNSRDTQEVPADKGRQVLKIIQSYGHRTSIFDDFVHYEQRQEEEEGRKPPAPHPNKEEGDSTAHGAERSRGRGQRS